MEQFKKELQALMRRTGKTVIMLGRVDGDDSDGEPVAKSLQALRAVPKLLVSKKAATELAKVAKELATVGAEPPGPGGFSIRFLTTIDSLDGHYILKKHLKRLRGLVKRKEWEDALALGLGIALAAKEDSFWYGDTEDVEEVEKICKDLSSLLHKILEQPAAVLGGFGTDDRAALDEAMRQMQDDMALVGFDELQWWD